MKRILTGALALVLFAGAAQAQSKQDTSKFHRRDGHEMRMTELNLSADQKAQLKSIHENERKEMQALKENKSLTAGQLKTQRTELHKKYQEQTQSVFTPAQKDQFQKMKADRREKGAKKGVREKREHKQGARKGGDFGKDLNLTQEQKDQLSKLRADSKTQFELVRNDKSLSDDQKKEKIQALRKDQQAKFQSVLTKEQLQKMESARKERKDKRTK